MFNQNLIALAFASALGMSACAHDAWQLPSGGHPADPSAQAGSFTSITSLQRYRASQAETEPGAKSGVRPDDDTEQDEPEAHRHGDHIEEPQ